MLRMTDFNEMMLRHPGERGITIDHYTALVVDGDGYRVVGLEGKGGSVLPDGGFSSEREGRPGVWIKDVVDGELRTTLAPWEGKLDELLKKATDIVEDEGCIASMRDNPWETKPLD